MQTKNILLPMVELAKTIEQSNCILKIDDVLNLIYYYTEIEAKHIEDAYAKSTIEQCKSVLVMFNENEMSITDDEMELIIKESKKYVIETYNTTQ